VKWVKYIAIALGAITLIIMIGMSLLFTGAVPQTAEQKALREKILAEEKADQERAAQQKSTSP
jgi:hypothetical protein